MPPIPANATLIKSTDEVFKAFKTINAVIPEATKALKASGALGKHVIPTISEAYVSKNVDKITVTKTITQKTIETVTQTVHHATLVIPEDVYDRVKEAASGFAKEIGEAVSKSQEGSFWDIKSHFSTLWSFIKDIVLIIFAGVITWIGWTQYAEVSKKDPKEDPGDVKEVIDKVNSDEKEWVIFRLMKSFFGFFGPKKQAENLEKIDEVRKKQKGKEISPRDLEEASENYEMRGGLGGASSDSDRPNSTASSGTKKKHKGITSWAKGVPRGGSNGSDPGAPLERQPTASSTSTGADKRAGGKQPRKRGTGSGEPDKSKNE
ncbi:MAG: hypothetical protein Q9159_006491 [Coniocarpon cinnabarinum]